MVSAEYRCWKADKECVLTSVVVTLLSGQLISSHDLLEIKGQNTTVGGSFDFLLLYSQFREHLSSGSNQQASQLLLQLFTLPSSRKDLWPILFIDALPLFQGKEYGTFSHRLI